MIQNIPTNPGCYLFKNNKGRIIYIGKAKNLKKRVNSYFQKKDHDAKTEALVKNIDDVDFIVTNSELEALILENTLIKKHQPHYNIDLKDSKKYAYLQITDEDFPKVIISRKKIGKGKFYGPFVSAAERDYVRMFVNKTFSLRTCKNMPKRACLRYHIKLCRGPCIGEINKTDYKRNISVVKDILKGKTTEVIKKLDHDMKVYAKKQKFEKSLELRNQMQSLTYLQERQNMDRDRKTNEDVINFIVKDGKVYLILFNVYKGVLSSKHEFSFDYTPYFFEEFIVQYYSENKIPNELIVPVKIDLTVNDYLEKIAKRKVKVNVPKQGAKKELINLVKKNVEISFFGDENKLIELQKALKLNEMPRVIECFDISHLAGTAMVGSMVQFRNAKPDKSNYRRFKIKTVYQIDDFESLKEVVSRRYKRLKAENSDLPDLIVIDGGKGQLSSCMEILTKLELKIPMISLAKRFEEVFFPGISIPLRMDKKSVALRYLQEIRDEAHRFAIKYNRLLRKKSLKD